MAKKNLQNTAQIVTNTFIKGLNKDSDPSYITEGMWTHAINAVNNTIEGDIGTLSNESSNFLCATAGATMPAQAVDRYIIGLIYLFSDKWLIFTAGHNALGQSIMSEIGLLEEDRCLYRPIVQDACLGFDKRFLISGSSREKEDCTWQGYWADGNNPDRYINIGDPKTWPDPSFTWLGGGPATMNYYSNGSQQMLWPGVEWNELCTDNAGCTQTEPGVWPSNCPGENTCITCNQINTLNCEKIRLARLMETPCLNLTLGTQGGTLANGTYFAVIAYLIKGQKVTDYFSQSNNQFIFTVNDLEGSLDLEVSADNENFDEFELVIVQNINQGTVAKKIGVYSTSTTRISIDQINPSNVTVPLELLPLQTPVFEKSDQMTEVNNYLLRVGPTSKFDFNYQPLANLIRTRWASVEYPGDYYVKGGNKTNYLRDEVYSFFIRWVYNTGDKSASYHIPGRAPRNFSYKDFNNVTQTVFETAAFGTNQNALASDDRAFEVLNTASQFTTIPVIPNTTVVGTNTILDDGGVVVAVGDMGYWESTEKYPDQKPEIWNSSAHCWTGPEGQSGNFDFCGKPIRHHKFPEDFISTPSGNQTGPMHFRSNSNAISTGDENYIRILGVYFENIPLPKDNEGNDIPGIVGYEILRGSREGNKTIIAKGMINNFRSYRIKGSARRNRTGLYANYPFNTIVPLNSSTDPNDHNYNVNDPYIWNKEGNTTYNQTIPKDIISFHSPDTMFRTPFLNTTEFKLYGYLSGFSTQQFQLPENHPKFKLVSNVAALSAIVTGIAEAIFSMLGKRVINQPIPIAGSGASDAAGAAASASVAGNATLAAAATTYNGFLGGYYSSGQALGDVFLMLTGGYDATQVAVADETLLAAINTAALSGATVPATINGTIELPKWAYLDPFTRTLGALNQIAFYFAEGADVTLKLIYAFIRYKDYALQHIAYGFYNNMGSKSYNDYYRFKIDDSFYLRDNIQQVNRYQTSSGSYLSYSINNLKRSDAVVLRTKRGDNETDGPKLLDIDKSLVTLGSLYTSFVNGTIPTDVLAPGNIPNFFDFNIPFSLQIGSHYGAIKGRVRNQYGQLDSIKQIIITPCEQKLSDYTLADEGPYYICPEAYKIKKVQRTPILFNGDTYINRYTEKNNMLFFYDWLYGQPNGFEFNYFLRDMIPNARFALNSLEYDISSLTETLSFNNPVPGTGALPGAFYNLDFYESNSRRYNYQTDVVQGANIPGLPNVLQNIFFDTYAGLFSVKRAYFYLATSSVRDFFVESDVLVDFRKQGDTMGEKHYDPYRFTDYPSMFSMNPNIMGRNSAYIYDYSLSVSKLYNQYFSAGNLQSRYYNPDVSELCFTYYPDRIIYSLPQQDEAIKDSWFIFLANNYKEFKSQISGVKAINKSGIFITFKNDSPVMYQGVDTLQTDLGTKITIGDGGLFSQPQQSVSNADKPYEYGSSQNRLSVISTPAGIFYGSLNQGKIFSFSQGLQEISQNGMKWWFTLFLPYRLTLDFPDYPYQDNPVAGIGLQAVYDNTSAILYFSKKDYKLKEEYVGRVSYIPLITTGKAKGRGDYFVIDDQPGFYYKLGDSKIFDDASWTISYDPKMKFWISFHDWHPDLFIPTKDVFLSTKKNGMWRHNFLCNDFCSFYGVKYPFEVELPVITGQTVTTLKSVEYILECYRRSSRNCVDQHHVLDYNFDRAIVYNSEQVSGYLNLNIFPKNNITLSQLYPRLNPVGTSYDILFSKEENKYRFNQFWDITKDRAEFPVGSDYPPTGPVIPGTTVLAGVYESNNTWITAPDGYSRILNPANMDYTKPLLERKKFRHYLNFLNLRRTESSDVNMTLKIINTKTQISLR